MANTPTLVMTIQFSLLALLCFFTTKPILSSALVGIKYHIHVINDLPPSGPNDLYVHCESRDSDKGGKQLTWHEDYTWGTRINYFGTTLYYCKLKWQGVDSGKEMSFDAFDAERDGERCEENKYCLWAVREDGVYFSNDNSTWNNEYTM